MNLASIGSEKPSIGTPMARTDVDGLERTTFAAGCFWGVEASFREIEGVVKTSVGYTGGRTEDPSYEQVCSGATGHAESVEVWFDPTVVSHSELLDAIWSCDRTSRRRSSTSEMRSAR